MSARIGILIKNLLILTFSIALTIAAAEVIIRSFDLPVPPKNKNIAPRYYYRADQVLGYDIRRNAARVTHHLDELSYDIFSNRFGCFDYDRMIPSEYILALGDSFTWGFAPLDRKWTTLLEKRLNKLILKCGVSGFGVKQSLHKGKRVISEVGRSPTAVIYMYYTNDLNDDVLMPHKTVYSGYLVSVMKSLNLETGEIVYRTDEEIERRFRKFKEGSWSNLLREFRYNLATYRLFQEGKDILERKFRAFKERLFSSGAELTAIASVNVNLRKMLSTVQYASANLTGRKSEAADQWPITKTHSDNLRSKGDLVSSGGGILNDIPVPVDVKIKYTPTSSFPPRVITNMYRLMLVDLVDSMDRPWFKKAVQDHKNNIMEMANTVRSLGAKFILIDVNGDLQHRQFRKIIEHFEASPDLYYYNLRATYANQETWSHDIHWNLQGNSDVADHIYNFFREKHLFSD